MPKPVKLFQYLTMFKYPIFLLATPIRGIVRPLFYFRDSLNSGPLLFSVLEELPYNLKYFCGYTLSEENCLNFVLK